MMWPLGPEASGAKAQDIASLNVGAKAPTHKHVESPSMAAGMKIASARINKVNAGSDR
jgi:hypothetical protein